MRILIAEDDPKLLKSLVHIFELNHYAVDGVDGGTDAFDFASSGECGARIKKDGECFGTLRPLCVYL